MSVEPQKARVDIDNEDSLSNSELVLDMVMSYLPIKDCVRTSILSSRWRYRWTTIPSLMFDCFDKTCFSPARRFETEEGKSLVGIVNRVLLIHNGSIQNFKFTGPCAAPDIDCWLLRLSRDSIKTLVLGPLVTVPYKLPSSLFTCGSLSVLKLENSLLSLPSSFEGFKNLKCLRLTCVTLTNGALEKLISSCPLLKKLELFKLEEANDLKINAPNLQHIDIFSGFANITFGYAMTKLSVVCIRARECLYTSLLDFLIKLPNIQRIELRCCNIGYMSADSIQEGFPFHCKDLYHLAISMDYSYVHYGEAVVFLYRSLSNFARQQMVGWRECYLAIELGDWKDSSECRYEFEKLRSVKVHKFFGTSPELAFVEYVLRNSPALETMTVNPRSCDLPWKYIKQICGFKRASKAEITFDGHVTQTKSGAHVCGSCA